ncbi:hypothetical protein ACFWUW_16045 [Streptomyces sp. NPDC058655]|uniref:hypothetical protein n=1 Tax=unclassified Streptomyces TaxID=2593676 RepID=UPI0036642B45
MALEDLHPASGDQPDGVCTTSAETPLRGRADVLAGAEFLPCGRPLGHAWEQARTPGGTTDPHTSRCPSCREAIEGLTALDRAARALRAQEGPDGHGVANRVIGAVRAEVRLGARLRHAGPPHNPRIPQSTAAKILRGAADTVPGARTASCRLTPSNGNRAVHAVAITVAAKLDGPLRERAEAVRQAVLHTAEHVLGLAVTTVDVEVTAVLEPSRMPGGEERSELSQC